MKYGFKKMIEGSSILVKNQGFNDSAYRLAMRCQNTSKLRFQGKLEGGDIRITCISSDTVRGKTQMEHDVDMVKAMIDWGMFPEIMRTGDALRICRKAMPSIPTGKAGKLIAGKLIAATGEYKRVRVYTGVKQVWLSVKVGIEAPGPVLWGMYEQK